jgi:hypothetical protein
MNADVKAPKKVAVTLSPERRLYARCGGCSRGFEEREWFALPLFQQLPGSVVARLVLGWPPGVSIEVRRCSECNRVIAHKGRGREGT